MAHRASSSVAASSATITVPKPSGTADGDILLFEVAIDSPSSAFTWPSGFAALREDRCSSDGELMGIAWKRAGGSEPTDYVATVASIYTDGDHTATVSAFSGRHATDPPVAATSAVDNNTNASPISVTSNGVTAVDGDDLLHVALLDPNNGGLTLSHAPPSGFTECAEQVQDWSGHGASFKESVAAGATGTLTAVCTTNTTAGWGAYLVRIPAAAAGGAAALPPRSLNISQAVMRAATW